LEAFSLKAEPRSNNPLDVLEILTHAVFLALSESKLILVIDDEEMILSVVSSMLHTLRYECSAAVDGVEGWNEYVRAKAYGRPFSAVLLDATIPNGISGEEALKLILAEDPDAGVTCVASVRELALR
jgi:CheY-like chemotaxis protein